MERSDFRLKLLEYFKKNLKKNYSSETLKWSLIKQGYSRTEVQAALEQATKELAEESSALKEKPRISYEILDEHNKPIFIKRPWWKRIFD